MTNHVLPPIGGGGSGGRESVLVSGSPFADLAALETWSQANPSELLNNETQVAVAQVGTSPNFITYSWVGADGVYSADSWSRMSELTTDQEAAVNSIVNAPDNMLLLARSGELEASVMQQESDETLRTPRSIRVGTNSIELDLAHVISSSGENVTFSNEQSNILYHPMWQTYDVGESGALIRRRFTEVTFPIETTQDTNLTNPNWSTVVPPLQGEEGQTILYADIIFDTSSVTTNINFELQIEGVTFSIFRVPSVTPDPVTGVYRFNYEPFFDFYTGSTLTFIVTSDDGDVVLKGNGVTNRPAVTVQLRLWNDLNAAAQDDLTKPKGYATITNFDRIGNSWESFGNIPFDSTLSQVNHFKMVVAKSLNSNSNHEFRIVYGGTDPLYAGEVYFAGNLNTTVAGVYIVQLTATATPIPNVTDMVFESQGIRNSGSRVDHQSTMLEYQEK